MYLPLPNPILWRDALTSEVLRYTKLQSFRRIHQHISCGRNISDRASPAFEASQDELTYVLLYFQGKEIGAQGSRGGPILEVQYR